MAIYNEKCVLEIEEIGRFEDFILMGFDEEESQDVTDHPVERGAPIVDNLDPKPLMLELELVLSGMGQENTVKGFQLEALKAAVQAARLVPMATPYLERLDKLRRAKREGRKVKVVSERGVYEDMIIARIGSPIENRLGLAARVRIQLQQIRTVDTDVVSVPEVRLALPTPPTIGKDPTPARHGPAGSGGRVIPEVWGGASLDPLKEKWGIVI